MKQMWAIVLVLAGCGGTAEQVPVEHPVAKAQEPEAWPPPSAEPVRSERPETPVAVKGIEGSMSSYDVRHTMEKRNAALAACHAPRARVVPALAGTIEFAIAVSAEGAVRSVAVSSSDLGDLTLERCLSQVIADTPFPRPNGGDARVSWNMMLEPARASSAAEAWERDHIAKVLDKKLPALREACEVGPQFEVTAYVNKKGKVASASARARRTAKDEELDCIVGELRSWNLPKPKTSRFAKVTFGLSGGSEGKTLARRR